MRLAILSMVAALGLMTTGCGGGAGSLNTVKGTVKYADGSNVNGAEIVLTPEGGSANTISKGTIKDGAFTIMTGDKEGAPAGKYKVTIMTSQNIDPTKYDPANPPDFSKGMKRAVAKKYEDPDQSGIVKEVTSGTNDWGEIKVEKPSPEEEMMGPAGGIGNPAGS